MEFYQFFLAKFGKKVNLVISFTFHSKTSTSTSKSVLYFSHIKIFSFFTAQELYASKSTTLHSGFPVFYLNHLKTNFHPSIFGIFSNHSSKICISSCKPFELNY
ncbi:MAG: hypothetical protein LBU14_02095 [Candidatus Peribacteria bacterium]|nr:hypothetical protein [Candidatus Peribacteria bacterium]